MWGSGKDGVVKEEEGLQDKLCVEKKERWGDGMGVGVWC